MRAREGVKQDQLRARHRVSKFLLRHGRHRPAGLRAWGVKYSLWLTQQQFELATLQVVYDEYRATLGVLADRVTRLERAIDAALPSLAPTQQALVGALATLRRVQQVTAATLVSELGTLRRFASARQLMGYAGLVPREHSSGSGVRRGAITKTGNAHLRRVLVEAAWAYRHRANTAAGMPDAVISDIAEDPTHVCLLRAQAQMSRSDAALHLIEQLWLGGRHIRKRGLVLLHEPEI